MTTETYKIISLIATFLLACGYALLIYKLQRRGLTEGFTSLLVVAGVGGTLLMAAPYVAGIGDLFVFFAASGIPMIFGDIMAFVQRREKGRELSRDE